MKALKTKATGWLNQDIQDIRDINDLVAEQSNLRVWVFAIILSVIFSVSLLFFEIRQLWLPLLLGLGAGILAALPIRHALYVYFFYLSVDGAVKINSDYNPVVHVAADLLLLALVFRAFLDKARENTAKFYEVPFFRLFVLFFIWILLQYLNPFALGILPSISGTKIYISMILFFGLCYHYLDPKDFGTLFKFIVVLSTLQAAFATVEYLYGQDWMFALHPRYRKIAGERFSDVFYRPFGTTTVPGGPSVWIAMAAPFAMYLFLKTGETFIESIFSKALAIAFFSFAAPALIFCQVRVNMIFTALTALAVGFFPGKGLRKRLFKLAILLAVVSKFFGSNIQRIWSSNDLDPLTVAGPASMAYLPKDAKISGEQMNILRSRFASLSSGETYTKARSGALNSFLEMVSIMPFGIGLSRTGAASTPWQHLIREDEVFGPRWSFTDNLYLTITTELGLPGLFAWLIMVLSPAIVILRWSLARRTRANSFTLWLCFVGIIASMISGFGNEGILYLPVSCFFWLFIAVGMKEVMYAQR